MKKLSYLFLAIIAMYITACGITPEIQAPLEDLTLPLADGKLDITFTDAKLNTDRPKCCCCQWRQCERFLSN